MMETLLKYKNIFFALSCVVVLASIVAIAVFGFKLGIDFSSGSLWQIRVPGTDSQELRGFFETQLQTDQINISADQNDTYTLTLREINDDERKGMVVALREKFGDGVEDADFWSVSPVVSKELKDKALWAVWLVLIGISLYIAFAFRKVSKPISSWKYGIITLITLLHDVIIPAALFAFLGKFNGVTIDTNFIVALLVVMGFSVHDTIVVFDRIRENLVHFRDRLSLEEIVDKSITNTIVRSINTSVTLVLVLLALYFWGPITLKYFILAILVGTVAGAYSSVFVASPLLLLAGKGKKRG